MRQIELTQGAVALVDDEDYERLSEFKWCLKIKEDGRRYAIRSVRIGPRTRTIYMHREIAAIIGLPVVDHWDRNGLNNQRSNLRPATHAQNAWNRRKRFGFASPFLGVSWYARLGKWRASLACNYVRHELGYFESEIEASIIRDVAAHQLHGRFASLNWEPVRGGQRNMENIRLLTHGFAGA